MTPPTCLALCLASFLLMLTGCLDNSGRPGTRGRESYPERSFPDTAGLRTPIPGDTPDRKARNRDTLLPVLAIAKHP